MKPVILAALAAILIPCAIGAAQPPAGSPAAPQAQEAKSGAAATQANPAALAAPKPEPGAMAAGAVPVDRKRFVIGAQDVLIITVWNEKELSRDYLVRPDGYISLAFAGEIHAAGESIEDLEKVIASKLKDMLTDPIVSVDIRSIKSTEYYMDGEWGRPGEYPLIVPTRVFEAISKAGGFREWANQKDIKIIRGGDKVFKFNYKEVSQGKKLEQNILLEPGDHVVVH